VIIFTENFKRLKERSDSNLKLSWVPSSGPTIGKFEKPRWGTKRRKRERRKKERPKFNFRN